MARRSPQSWIAALALSVAVAAVGSVVAPAPGRVTHAAGPKDAKAAAAKLDELIVGRI